MKARYSYRIIDPIQVRIIRLGNIVTQNLQAIGMRFNVFIKSQCIHASSVEKKSTTWKN